MMQQNSSVAKIGPAREGAGSAAATAGSPAMLSPSAAWRSLCARTGGFVTMVTFYRWVRSGKVYSIRLGQRIFIPREALDDLIKACLSGERF